MNHAQRDVELARDFGAATKGLQDFVCVHALMHSPQNEDGSRVPFGDRPAGKTPTHSGVEQTACLPSFEGDAPLPMPSKKYKSTELRELMAKRLKAARMAYDEQAAIVARALDVSKQRIHDYESGRTFPDELFLVKFVGLTGCPLDWIFFGKITPDMPPQMAARIAISSPDLVRLGKAEQARTTAKNTDNDKDA